MAWISQRDLQVLRGLAAEVAEAAADPVNRRRLEAWSALNQLKPAGRPLVWINEICWWEFQDLPELAARCTGKWARGVEKSLRQLLLQWRRFGGDMILDPVWTVPVHCSPTSSYADYGIAAKEIKTAAGLQGTAMFEPVIACDADVDRLRTPRVTVDWRRTWRELERMQTVCDGILPCEARGIVHQWTAAWDQMIHWYGIERLYTDMFDRPELVHRLLRRFWDAVNRVLDQQEALGLLATGNGNWRVGSGGLGCTPELPRHDHEPLHIRPRDQWGCSTAQIFSEVSPDMHWEFSLQYEKPYLERFGLSYYGCCEPLHTKMGILKRVGNLRKISASPWADLEKMAEQAGTGYVLSFKPNPAHLAMDHWNPGLVRSYLRDSLRKLQGCRVEVILKDISTVRSDPRRLEAWARVAMEVAEEAAS